MSAFTALLVVASTPRSLPALPPAPSVLPGISQILDGEDSAHICPVCGSAIPFGKGHQVVVRGREYTVDDGACGEALAANPDKYLDPDGTPKNAKRKEDKPA